MYRIFLELLACPRCGGEIEVMNESLDEILEGSLDCVSCKSSYPVRRGIPSLLDDEDLAKTGTSELYTDIWKGYEKRGASKKNQGYRAPAKSHTELLRMAADWELVQGEAGIDAGCGRGSTAIETARRHPNVQVVGVDLSDGLELDPGDGRITPNAHLVRGNLLRPPLRKNRFDFAYSFGVLHHTPDPERAFTRLLELLKPGARVTIFLYKDFSDIPWKRFLLRMVNSVRSVTTKLPPRLLRALSWTFAPFVYLFLTLPARLLNRTPLARLSQHIPYGTFPHLTSVASSLEDRFGAPYEFRFSIEQLTGWLDRAGLEQARVVDCLPFGFSGLVMAGVKPYNDSKQS